MKKILNPLAIVTSSLLVFLTGFSSLRSQASSGGLAGPDKHTCKNDLAQTIAVKIGPGATVPGTCYRWTPTSNLDDPNSSSPMASPPVTTVYTLTVIFDNFNYEISDNVTVYVDQITSLIVTPKQCCFKVGETFKADQFNVTTVPAGLETDLSFDPPAAPAIYAVPDQDVSITVKSKCMEGGQSTSNTVVVHVVNSEQWASAQVNIGDIEAGITKLEGVLDKLAAGTDISVLPCSFSPPAAERQFSYAQGKLCCATSGCVKDRYKVAGTYKGCVKYNCDVPIPYLSLPAGLAGFNVALYISCCLGLSVDYRTNCDGGDICLSGTSEFNVAGGISGTVLSGKAIKAYLVLQNQINSPTIQLCLPSKSFKFVGSLCYQLDIVGSVTFLGGISEQVKYNLIPKTCWSGTGIKN